MLADRPSTARPEQGRAARSVPAPRRREDVAAPQVEVGAGRSAAEPPPLPRELTHAPAFERRVAVDGFLLGPDAAPLLPPLLATVHHAPISAAADVRHTGLGWTEEVTLEHGLAGAHWALSGRWAPPALSARAAPVGVGGPVVAEGEGAVSAPRGAWHASGLLGGPLAGGSLGAVVSLEANGVGLPAAEPGLAGGGRARQTLAFTTTWVPGGADRLSLLVLGGRRTESPDCFRCTDTAARVHAELAAFAGLAWTHALGRESGLELRLGAEHRIESAAARMVPERPGHLDLSSWVTDGAPGPLGPDLGASTLDEERTRLRLAARLHSVLGLQRLEGGIEAHLDGGRSAAELPGGLRFLDHGAPCGQAASAGCAFRMQVAPVDVRVRGWALGGYLEDALRLGELTLRAGVRLDAAQAGAGETTTGLRLGVAPRLALAWNLGGAGRHWLLLHAGRSHDPELQTVVTRAVLPVQQVAAWGSGAFDPCAQPGPSCVRLGGVAAVTPGGLPRVDEVALGWRGQPARGVEGGVEARWRHAAELWTEEESALLTDERGRWISSDGGWTSRRVLATDPRAWRRALGLGAWARARAGPARVSIAWSLAHVSGTAAGPFDRWLADPRTAALATGPLPDDQRHRVVVSLALLAHPAVELGARFRYATGAPLWETYSVPDSAGLRTVRGSRGTGVLESAPVTLRDPEVFVADAWIRLRLGALFPAALPRLDLTVEAAQVAGGNTPVHLSASSSRLGAVLRREPPFQLVLGLRASAD